MKQIIVAFTAGLTCLCMSCNDKAGGVDAITQKNLDAAHGINKSIETGDVSKLGDYIAADAVDHGDKGEIKGVDSIKAMLGKIHSSATDMKSETLKELADNDYVFQWMRFTGTSATSDMGMPAGTKYDMNAIEVSKFKDGKVVEHWEFMQPADMMKMMSSMPHPDAAAPHMDSTTMAH